MIKVNPRLVYAFIAVVHVAACFWTHSVTLSMLLAVSYIILAIASK